MRLNPSHQHPCGARMPMGNLTTLFFNSHVRGGWSLTVSFYTGSSKLAWVGHWSLVMIVLSVAEAAKHMMVMKIKTDLLPMLILT